MGRLAVSRSIVALSLSLLCAATGKKPELAQRNTIDRFYRIACSNTATVRTFVEIFGDASEGELTAAAYALFPGRAIESLSDADSDRLNAQVLEPNSHRSEFLACLWRVWPEVFCAKEKRIIEGPSLVKGLVEFRVSVAKQQVTFVFVPGVSTISNIRFSNGKSVNGQLAKCAGR